MCLPARPLVSTGRGVREEGEWAVVEGSGVGQTGLSRMLHSFILAKVLLLFFIFTCCVGHEIISSQIIHR